jgi:DNA-binding MarR family transcriptional regulator
MFRVSKQTRDELIVSITDAVVRFQESADKVDTAAAAQLGLNATDLNCLGLLVRTGGMTAGELSAASALSPAATTTAIERLESAGYATRERDEEDRRRVVVRATRLAEQRTDRIYRPVLEGGVALLRRYNRAELDTILNFLEAGTVFQQEQAERIRALRATR